jgi:hypothetical protein
MREQTTEFMTPTTPTVPIPAPIGPSRTHDRPDPVPAVGPVPASGTAVAREAPPAGPDAPAGTTPDDLLARYGLALGQLICVDGERGTYQLRGIAADGSVTVVGGPSRAGRPSSNGPPNLSYGGVSRWSWTGRMVRTRPLGLRHTARMACML